VGVCVCGYVGVLVCRCESVVCVGVDAGAWLCESVMCVGDECVGV